MILDTTAPAEELQDKLSALEQLLLAYGRVAIGFSGGVDSSFLAAVCARIMPTNTLLVHLATPLIGTPEQASFERCPGIAIVLWCNQLIVINKLWQMRVKSNILTIQYSRDSKSPLNLWV